MIGLGPHTMSVADWVAFVAVLQVTLILLAAFSIWLAADATRAGTGR